MLPIVFDPYHVLLVTGDISTKVFEESKEHYSTMRNKHYHIVKASPDLIEHHEGYNDDPENNDRRTTLLPRGDYSQFST